VQFSVTGKFESKDKPVFPSSFFAHQNKKAASTELTG
jgi:hypothetical protein